MDARHSQLGPSAGMRNGPGMMRGRPGPYDRMPGGMGHGYGGQGPSSRGSRNVKSKHSCVLMIYCLLNYNTFKLF